MPVVIREFALAQMFTWTGMFCFWLYFGIGLAQHVYGLPAGVAVGPQPEYQRLLEQGTLSAGICCGIYQLISVVYALLIPRLSERSPPRKVHAMSLLIGAVSLILIMFTHQMLVIYLLMIGVGIMWGSLMTMPYAIIAAELPRAKMGVYLGVFNITVTIPQISAGLFMGSITQHVFNYQAIYAVVLGGFFILVSVLILLYQLKLAEAKLAAPSASKTVETVMGDAKMG